MRAIIIAVACAVLIQSSAIAAEKTEPVDDWKKTLSKELVIKKQGKMVIEEFKLCKGGAPGSVQFQMKTHSEAPAKGTISRDNFIAFHTFLSTLMSLQMAATQGGIDTFGCKDLKEVIGKVDIEVNIYMNNEGFKVEFVNVSEGKRSGFTNTWRETLGN